MDWKQILSLSMNELSDERQEEIYSELIKDQKFDGKIAKKLFPLCLTVLKFKGLQVEKQQEQIELITSSDIDLKETLELVDKQKKHIAKYETERVQYKSRIKELSEELVVLQSANRDAQQGSDEDSPDQMSEIDRQQELFTKLSAKNKHITRLLKDIEILDRQNATYLNKVKELKNDIEEANMKADAMNIQLVESQSSVKFLEDQISNFNMEFTEKESEIRQMRTEKLAREKELEEFSHQLEQRTQVYKSFLDDKQHELDMMTRKYENLIDQLPAGFDVDSEQSEIRRMADLIRQRDELINVLEGKTLQLSEQVINSTELIGKLTRERDEFRERLTREKKDKCCEDIQAMLLSSNKRCEELQEMLVGVENDNLLKSKQAYEAFETLKSYENSTDGLADALRKIHQLQESCHEKDVQIMDHVRELNAQNEVVAENAILRRRCGVPDDEIIETKAFLAKQKRFAKANERLTLKLRASEELRLQLKIDKNDLKRRIAVLELGDPANNVRESISSIDDNSAGKRRKSSSSTPILDEIKKCEACSNSFSVFDSIKFCKNCIRRQNSASLCDNCVSKFKTSNDENMELLRKIAKLEIDNKSIAEKNEHLRIGLNEILENLRDNEGPSERTVINPAILEKLIAILKLGSVTSSTLATSQMEGHVDGRTTSSPVAVEAMTDYNVEVDKLKQIIGDLSEQNDELSMKIDQMKVIEKNYEELVRCSQLSDDDKNQLMVKSLQRCHEFETNLAMYERKIEYLNNENGVLFKELNNIKLSAMETIHELEIQIYEKSSGLTDEIEIDNFQEDEDPLELEELRSELQDVRSQLSTLCLNVLNTAKTVDNQGRKFIENVSVIEKNLTASVITRQELTHMERKISVLEDIVNKKQLREKQLDELVRVMNTQMKSQQLLLSQFSDNEISTRHLIVDLQSRSNESHLIAKTTKELQLVKDQGDRLRLEGEKMREEIELLREKLIKSNEDFKSREAELIEKASQNQLKLQYLQKTLVFFCKEYSSMTPIYLIADFIKDYSNVIELKNQLENEKNELKAQTIPPISTNIIIDQLRRDTTATHKITDIESRVEIIKYKSSCEYLKNQLDDSGKIIRELHEAVSRAKRNEIRNEQHWNAIKMLFSDDDGKLEGGNGDGSGMKEQRTVMHSKQVQVDIKKRDFGVNTDELSASSVPSTESSVATVVEAPQIILHQTPQMPIQVDDDQEPLKSQLKKALMLAQTRSVLLIETENRLSEAHGRVKSMEKSMENRERQHQKEKEETMEKLKPQSPEKDSSLTISTLQRNLLEKDTTLSKYLELLKVERQQNMKMTDELENDIKGLKKSIAQHETSNDEKEKLIDKLNKQIEEMHEKIERKSSNYKSSSPTHQQHQAEKADEREVEYTILEVRNRELQNTIKQMEQQQRDLTNIERQLQSTLQERDNTIKELRSKLKIANTNYGASLEIDQLRDLLEEKDRQIQDLTETLNQFHDDQQKYINDTALNSAEQVQIMSSDLNRADLSNKVLKTQLDAMKRQLEQMQTRETNGREMIKTLKNQLIRRPVIAVKNAKRPATTGEENYQRRVRDLENELIETKDELRRQANIIDNKRAKNAAELGLWEKAKRYQEQAEKVKAKLTDSEIDNERLKATLQMAKNTVVKLEREKNLLENKLKSDRYRQNVAIAQKSTGPSSVPFQKYSSDSGASIFSEPISSEINSEIFSSMQSRIESQQRKIVAIELDSRGPKDARTMREIEKLQNNLFEVEAKNIRLEGTISQLQLECANLRRNNPEKQNDERVSHLERYIMTLKEDLASERAKNGAVAEKPGKTDPSREDERQTILHLKRIIEQQKVELKKLRGPKSGASSHVSSSSNYETRIVEHRKDEQSEMWKMKNEYKKLQRRFDELMCRTSALEVELELAQSQAINNSCPHCNNLSEFASKDADVLSQQLQQKSQLLDKAKALLTRSVCTEKHLKFQIAQLKKRICELEGVPAISEENSESSQL